MGAVSVPVQINCFETCEALLDAGVPVHKLAYKKFRGKLEESCSKITGPAHMAESTETYLEPVLMREFSATKEEVGDRVICSLPRHRRFM